MSKKKLLITGANKPRGIGVETLRLFLEADYEAVVVARDFSKFEFANNPNVKTIEYDLANLEGIPSLIKEIGHVDVVVNNSGVNNFTHYKDYTQDQLTRILNVNLLAPAAIIKEVLADWEKTGFGRIINVGSTSGRQGNRDIWYGATKAAIANLTKSFFLLEGSKGLIINAVEPGLIDSNWYKDVKWRQENVGIAQKAGKVIQPEDVAKTIFWLGTTSPVAVNGEAIPVSLGD